MRILDVGISLVVLVITLPIILTASILIFFEDRKAPWFVQRRIGQFEKEIVIVKLRTMKVGTSTNPTHLIGPEKISRIGFILRFTKIDELPQFLNVIFGSMSIVGPRPCLINQVDLIALRRKSEIFLFKPGITGPCQCLGVDMRDPGNLVAEEAGFFRDYGVRFYLKWVVATIGLVMKALISCHPNKAEKN